MENHPFLNRKRSWCWIVILVISLIGTACVPTATRSSIAKPEQTLPAHLSSAQAPVWRLPVKASEIECAEIIDEHTLLMTTSMVAGYMQIWGLRDHDVILADLQSGQTTWRLAVSELGHTIKTAYAAEDCVLLFGTDQKDSLPRLSAVNRKDGRVVWTQLLPAGFVIAYDKGNRQIVAAGPVDDGGQAMAYQIRDGAVRWKHSFSKTFGRSAAPWCSLHLVGSDLIVTGAQIARLRPKDGAALWQIPLDQSLQQATLITRHGSCLLLSGNRQIRALSLDNGDTVWDHRLPDGKILARMTTGTSLFSMEEADHSTYMLRKMDRQTGRTNWQAHVPEVIRSPLISDGGEILLTTQRYLARYSVKDGTALARMPLPAFMHTVYGLPDHILLDRETITVARECGLAAFDRKTGEQRYAHPVKGTQCYSHHFASQRYLLRTVSRTGGPGRAEKSAALTKELQRQVIRYNTGVDPQFAQNVPRTANQALSETTMAAANMAASVAAAGIAFRNVAVSENLAINKKEINAALTCHALSIQHGYYVRPFYQSGWGVTLVRLSDGARSDLFVSAPNEPLAVNSGNFPIILIDPLRRQLLVNGIGLHPNETETYSKVGFGKEVYKTWPGIPPTWIVPTISVFSYDLRTMAFNPYQHHPLSPAPPVLTENNRKLRAAILNGDRQQVAHLVKIGTDVNAVDAIGFNSLFYAAMVDDKKIAKTLIEAGADATWRDAHGLLAYHYTFLTHGDNRSTGLFRSANLKQSK